MLSSSKNPVRNALEVKTRRRSTGRKRPGSAALILILVLVVALVSPAPAADVEGPLTLVQTINMPDVPAGPYADHMAIDVKGGRLFTTPQAEKAVVVLDLKAGKVLRTIRGFVNPHTLLYRSDRSRLYVTDGKGELVILDAVSYRRLKSIPLEADADEAGYDQRTGLLYVGNGGDEAGKAYSLVSVIDTIAETKIGDIRIEAPSLEGMIVDGLRNRLYVNMPDDNAIGIVDLGSRALVDRWPLKLARRNEAFAIDAAQHLLFVGCNENDVRGRLVVIDTRTGRELQALPLGSWVDGMHYDARRQRVYASTGIGEVFSYQRAADGKLQPLAAVDTAVMARASLFSPELDRLFVMVPHLGWTPAKVLVFRPEQQRDLAPYQR
jgi:DNA-binding beta-propeller fold protein YncE